MKSNRNEAIAITLKWEGGYSNHPQDPGGPTNWGITLADARKYWKRGATAADVKAMPKQVAIDIYTSKYWKTSYYDCDNLASGVDLAVFDFGVNSGPSRAKQHLDKAVGGSAKQTVNKIMDSRMAFLKRLKTWPTFGVGWTRRCVDIRKQSLRLAEKNVNPSTATVATSTATAGTAVATTWLGMEPITAAATCGGVVLAGICLYFGYKWYKNRKTKK